jgi:hypothetical protein
MENNQLKYVCKHLYAETKGLDLHHNLMIFDDAFVTNALEQCRLLLRHFIAFRAVAIEYFPQSSVSNYSNSRFSTIERYYRIHPSVQIRITYLTKSQADPNFVPLALEYLSALQADASLAAQLAQNTSLGPLSAAELFLPPT